MSPRPPSGSQTIVGRAQRRSGQRNIIEAQWATSAYGARVRYGICVPNLAEFSDPRRVAALARRAEEAGWDGFFVWDHVVFAYGVPETADPWVLLTVIATATERIRLGPLVTPVARRRPGTLARQATSLDRLSGGRLIFGAGLGFTLPAEYGTWGESVDPRVVAGRLDEGLEVLARLWSGERVDFRGEHCDRRWRNVRADCRRSGRGPRSGSAVTGRAARRCAGRRAGTASRR